MILSDIKHYVQRHQYATLHDLALHFQSEPEAVRGMLEHWIRKGKVRKQNGSCSCKGCTECNPGKMDMYEWIG